MMPIVHRPTDRHKHSPTNGREQDPRLDRQPALVVDLHLSREVEGEVDESAEGAGGVARGEGAEAVVEEVGAGADLPRGEGVRGWVGETGGGLAAILCEEKGSKRKLDMAFCLFRYNVVIYAPADPALVVRRRS
jgi:hypothetical protein